MGGTYAIVLAIPENTTVEVGALGPITFSSGGYAYAGSALGSGGFSRVDRHRRVAAGDHDVRHWHIDYLLGTEGVTIESVIAVPEADVECALARNLAGEPVPAFGASDCSCGSHLVHFDSVASTQRVVVEAFLTIAPAGR